MPPIRRRPARRHGLCLPGRTAFPGSEHLILGNGLGCRNRSHVVLDCHENLRPHRALSRGQTTPSRFMEGHHNAAAHRMVKIRSDKRFTLRASFAAFLPSICDSNAVPQNSSPASSAGSSAKPCAIEYPGRRDCHPGAQSRPAHRQMHWRPVFRQQLYRLAQLAMDCCGGRCLHGRHRQDGATALGAFGQVLEISAQSGRPRIRWAQASSWNTFAPYRVMRFY